MTSSTEGSDIQKLARMIKGMPVAMLTTRDEDGTLRSRPMGTQEAEFDGTLWFFTEAGSPKVGEINREHEVNVSYSDAGSNRYISVSGWATLVRDREKIRELWTPGMKAWFPKGMDDPQVALLRVDVAKAEYWDQPGSTVVQLAGFVKATATGRRYEPGENEKLDLR